jgi:hypothetical protein
VHIGFLTFAIPGLSTLSSNSAAASLQQLMMVLLLPGEVCAIAASGNIHAWHLWTAAAGNFIFYFAVTWLVSKLWRALRSPA